MVIFELLAALSSPPLTSTKLSEREMAFNDTRPPVSCRATVVVVVGDCFGVVGDADGLAELLF